MKRYYTPEGEPDEAKTLWEAVKNWYHRNIGI